MCSCIQIIHDGNVKKSRKEYTCMAWEFIRESILTYRKDFKLTFSEWRMIVRMREKKGKILKGEPYYWQFNTGDGDVWTFRASKEMYDLCVKYDLFPCEC